MSKPSDSDNTKKALRDRIVGLGERSVCKSYFPQLQQQIEELKKSKAELEAAREKTEAGEARLQSLFTAAPVGIGVVLDRKFQFVNQALCKMLGYPEEAFIGKNIRFIYASDEAYNQVGIEIYDQMRQTGNGSIETRFRRQDGSIIDVLMSSCPIDREDWSKGITLTGLDITERKKTEKALQYSEEKYRELVENINEAIFSVDLQGIVTYISPKIESMLGYNPKEIIGKEFIDFVYSEDIELIQKRFESLSSSGGGFSEYRFIDKAGKILWVRASRRPKYKDSRIVGSMGTLVDITEQKKLVAELQQSRKMEAIGTLAGGIAHDFNNILAAVIGYTELSLDLVSGENELKENLNGVLTAGTRARDLIRQILTFSRQQENKLSDIQVKPVVKETLKFLRSSLPATIEIRQRLIDKESWTVRADPTQIQQVVMNLCANAVHSMEMQGGVLEICLEQFELQGSFLQPHLDLEPGPYVKLTVKDTGHGISPQDLSSIFDPYFTTKKIGKGTGLGLSVVYGIIKTLGGDICAQSEPGTGSTFEAYFPAGKHKTVLTPDTVKNFPKGKEKILLIDDEPSVARTSQRRLDRLGYQVETETDSCKALELFHANPDVYDLILTDMTMPKMTGEELAKEIMKIRPEIPVILCTGDSSKVSFASAEKAGIKALLLKPVLGDELAKTVRRVLDESLAD